MQTHDVAALTFHLYRLPNCAPAMKIPPVDLMAPTAREDPDTLAGEVYKQNARGTP